MSELPPDLQKVADDVEKWDDRDEYYDALRVVLLELAELREVVKKLVPLKTDPLEKK